MTCTVQLATVFDAPPACTLTVCLEEKVRETRGRRRVWRYRTVRSTGTDERGQVTFTVRDGAPYYVTVKSPAFLTEPRRMPVRNAAAVVVRCLLRADHCPPQTMQFPAFESLSDGLKDVLKRSGVLAAKLQQGRQLPMLRAAAVPSATALPEAAVDTPQGIAGARPREAAVACDERAATLYRLLEPVQRAALLNLFVKMRAASVAARNVWDYVRELDRVEADRVHAYVCRHLVADIRAEMEGDNGWREVLGWLHEAPRNYRRALSAKTGDVKGNLQVTVFIHRRSEWNATQMDADIDLEGSWHRHLWEVLRNHVTGNKTHQGMVYQVLMWPPQRVEPHRHFQISHLLRHGGSNRPWVSEVPAGEYAEGCQ